MGRRGALLLAAVLGAGGACGGEAPQAAGGQPADGGPAAAGPDSLVLLALRDSLSPARFPPDWYDLLHPRFAERLAFPDPAESPLARDFMETVMRREAARTGDPLSGLDWLLRWDGAVATYYGDVRDGVLPFLRGEVTLLVIPASQARDLLAGGEVWSVPLESGGRPRVTFPGALAGRDSAGLQAPDLPPDWFDTWRTGVRGRNPGR